MNNKEKERRHPDQYKTEMKNLGVNSRAKSAKPGIKQDHGPRGQRALHERPA